MANLTRAEMEQMQLSLISASDGTIIQSVDHRSFNSAMMDFFNSFLPKELIVNGAGNDPDMDGSGGSVTNAALVKRDVSSILIKNGNISIGPSGFTKDTASDTLYFRGGNNFVVGTVLTINFAQT